MKIIKLTTFAFVSLIVLVTAFGAGFNLHSQMFPTQAHFPILSEAYHIIREHGYDDIPETPIMEYGAIHGMIGTYEDQHTHFLEPNQTELKNDTLSGSYGGIGADMERDPEGYIVLHPYPESPASNAGLQDGDRLLYIDGVMITQNTTMEDVEALVRGPEGKNTTLTIARLPDYRVLEFTVERVIIPLPSVTYHTNTREARLGVIRINVIASSTPGEIKDAVKNLQIHGAQYFALDLRGNGGGLLKEGIEIARLFLKDGVVIQHQYKNQDVETFNVKNPGPLSDIPLVVLVDNYTASAAEIISGAIQSHNRGPLIGTPTFGKDSIQLVFELQDKSSIHVTSAKWWVPGLEPPIGNGGLLPDILVSTESNLDSDPYLDAAIKHFLENK